VFVLATMRPGVSSATIVLLAVAGQLAAGPDPAAGGADLQPQILAEQVKTMRQIVRVARLRTAMVWGA
jgi:hypothetical protein